MSYKGYKYPSYGVFCTLKGIKEILMKGIIVILFLIPISYLFCLGAHYAPKDSAMEVWHITMAMLSFMAIPIIMVDILENGL